MLMGKMKMFESFVHEKNLSRTMKHTKESEYAVLTAWRSGKTTSENLRNMKKLEGDLNTMHYGFIDMHGVGQEHGGKSYEKSLMVVNNEKRENFRAVMLDLASKYEQDFILHGKDGKTQLVDCSTGEGVQTFTKAVEGEAEYYSAIRGVKRGKHAFHLEEEMKFPALKIKTEQEILLSDIEYFKSVLDRMNSNKGKLDILNTIVEKQNLLINLLLKK